MGCTPFQEDHASIVWRMALTIGEFLQPLPRASQRDLVLAAMYYLRRYEGHEAVTTSGIKNAFVRARHQRGKRIQHAAVLSQAAPFVHSPGKDNRHLLWSLTETGDERVRELLDLPTAEPEVEHEVGALQALASKVTDEDVRGYVEEAIKCLQVSALRAAVVFLWTGAVATLRDGVWAQGAPAVNACLRKHDPKARDVKKMDDFAYVKDGALLQAAEDFGLIDKTEKTQLGQALDLRNSCGHPTRYVARVKKVAAFVEDVVGIVWR
jgi:hypothetical protein